MSVPIAAFFVAIGASALVRAEAPSASDAPEEGVEPAADIVESVQQRAWPKRNAFAITPTVAGGLDDPFLWRGGGGLRATWWPRSLVGLSLEASGWAQATSEAARVAQRELRARIRPTGSPWNALGSAELTAADGKLASFGSVVPFELVLKVGAGAAGVPDEDSPSLLLAAGAGFRWFLGDTVGLETNLIWRSSSLVRDLAGQRVSGRDTTVALEIGVPLRLGGGR